MANKDRINLSLDAGIVGLLDQAGNRSGYVSSVVEQRWIDWHAALDHLRSCGWHAAEVKAACDVLNGCWMLPQYGFPLGSRLAAELHDGQRLNGVAEKWDVEPERWAEVVTQLASNSEIGRALLTVVVEFWSFNEACELAIEKL